MTAVVPDDPLMPEDVRRAFAARPGREAEAPQRSVLHGHEAAAPSAIEPVERSLLLQARAGVQRLPAWMFSGLDDREQLALALVFEAKVAGLTRIDDVVPSASGTGVFAVQGNAGDAEHRSIYVSRPELAAESLDVTRERLQRQEDELARRRAAERAAMEQPDGPATPLQRLRSMLP